MTVMTISPDAAPPSRLAGLRSAAGYVVTVLKHLAGNPASAFGLIVIAVLLVMAIFAPLIATQDPYAQDLAATLQPPSMAHFFGTEWGATSTAVSSTARGSRSPSLPWSR